MSRKVQSWIGIASILLAVCCAAWRGDADAETIVQPIIDRPGECTYCDVVAEAFAGAESTIDLLLSNAEMEANPLIEPLLAAHQRGVAVRVLLDESDWSASITSKNRPTLETLKRAGIDARFDNPAVTTHAKLAMIDGETTLLGSSNWNRYAFTDQEQANIRIVDRRVASAFGEWFDALWDGQDGIQFQLPDLPPSTTPQIVALPDGDGVATYASAAITLLDRARSSVHIALYRMSHYVGYGDSAANGLIDAVVRAARRGLDVRVLMDDCSFYRDSAEANLETAIYLSQVGIPVRFDEPEETMHAKLVVIDGCHTVLGSTNWNYYALAHNNEASVALVSMPEVAAVFEQFFESLWADGRTLLDSG